MHRIKSNIRKKYFGLAGLDFSAEVQPYIKELKGLVLNAGSGIRSIDLNLSTLSTDIDETAPVDFFSDLHYIPLQNESIDSIISIAVLEHTRFPWVVAKEFYRILKPGGSIVLCVPFIQPEHAIPHDFFRYTVYGAESLLTYAGFHITYQRRLSRFHRAIGWLLKEKWANSRGMLSYLQLFLINLISRQQSDLELPPLSVYTGSYTVATKDGDWFEQKREKTDTPLWYSNLLVDPVSKEPLRWKDGLFNNNLGEHYGLVNGKYDFRPKGNLSQDAHIKWGKSNQMDHVK